MINVDRHIITCYSTLDFKKIQKHSLKVQSHNVTKVISLHTSFWGLELFWRFLWWPSPSWDSKLLG